MLMAALVVGSTTCDSPPTSPTATSCGCTLRRIAPTNTTMSAVFKSASFALDGNFATYASTKGETFPWIALELSPDSLVLVRKVAIVLIAHANSKLFASVEVRVATSLPTLATKRFEGGAVLGSFEGPGRAGEVVEVGGEEGVTGRYVVIQREVPTTNWALQAAEILIYSDYSME